jgi:hypothetical protein
MESMMKEASVHPQTESPQSHPLDVTLKLHQGFVCHSIYFPLTTFVGSGNGVRIACSMRSCIPPPNPLLFFASSLSCGLATMADALPSMAHIDLPHLLLWVRLYEVNCQHHVEDVSKILAPELLPHFPEFIVNASAHQAAPLYKRSCQMHY